MYVLNVVQKSPAPRKAQKVFFSFVRNFNNVNIYVELKNEHDF